MKGRHDFFEELELARTPHELRVWALDMRERLAADPTKKEFVRNRSKEFKILLGEAVPLAIFASHYYAGRDDIFVRVTVSISSHDGEIIKKCEGGYSEPLLYVEVTQAHEGESEYLRNVALTQ